MISPPRGIVEMKTAYRGAFRPTIASANRPKIVLADEPTAALDSQRAGVVMNLLKKVASEQQTAILVVTHDNKVFDRLDRIFHLRNGRIDPQEV